MKRTAIIVCMGITFAMCLIGTSDPFFVSIAFCCGGVIAGTIAEAEHAGKDGKP